LVDLDNQRQKILFTKRQGYIAKILKFPMKKKKGPVPLEKGACPFGKRGTGYFLSK